MRAYTPGEIDVAGQKLRSPFILSASSLITDWAVRGAAELDLAALEPLLALRPDVIVIGADGERIPVTGPWRREVEARNVSIEVGVMRHADAGYDEAVACAREQGLNMPMLQGGN